CYLNRLDESAGFLDDAELLIRSLKVPVRCFLLVRRDRNSSNWLTILRRRTEGEVNRMDGQINVHRILRSDSYIKTGFHDNHGVGIDGNAVIHDLTSYLLPNALFIKGCVLIVASDTLNILLKLIVFCVWRQQLERQVNEANNYKNTEY